MEERDERGIHRSASSVRDDQTSLTFSGIRERGVDDPEMIALGRGNFRLLHEEPGPFCSQGYGGLTWSRGQGSQQRLLDILEVRTLLG